MITFALSKGRILDDTRPLLRTAGIDVLEDPESSRKLILPTQRDDVRVVLVRASDVPTYVQQGGADIGISGKDVLMEQDTAGLYEPLDLNIAKCRLMVAVRNETDYEALVQRGRRLRVATKYPNLARRHYRSKGISPAIIPLYGSVELGAITGLADQIVDLVESGETLRQNRLVEVETIMHVTSRLIVHPASLKLEPDRLAGIIDALRDAVHRAGAANEPRKAVGDR